MQLSIFRAESAQQLEDVRQLFTEYAGWLGPLLCFPNVVKERAALPGEYAPPRGALLLATVDGEPAGCVALRPLEAGPPSVAEVKRLYVRPGFRGHKLGRRLMERLLELALAAGYDRLRLDTVESIMSEAAALYRSMGFVTTERYSDHVEGSVCMELELGRPAPRRQAAP